MLAKFIVVASLILVWQELLPIPNTLSFSFTDEIPSSIFDLSILGTKSPSDFELFTPPAPTCNKILSALSVSFTLVSQLPDDRVWMLQHHCERWGNYPMSIVVVTDRIAVEVQSELVLMGCSAEQVTVQTISTTKYNLSETEYPVNLLRNMALSAVKTSHIIYADVDFWPSTRLHSILSNISTQESFASDPKLAAVVPTFQLHQ
jgi:hypothetical protein